MDRQSSQLKNNYRKSESQKKKVSKQPKNKQQSKMKKKKSKQQLLINSPKKKIIKQIILFQKLKVPENKNKAKKQLYSQVPQKKSQIKSKSCNIHQEKLLSQQKQKKKHKIHNNQIEQFQINERVNRHQRNDLNNNLNLKAKSEIANKQKKGCKNSIKNKKQIELNQKIKQQEKQFRKVNISQRKENLQKINSLNNLNKTHNNQFKVQQFSKISNSQRGRSNGQQFNHLQQMQKMGVKENIIQAEQNQQQPGQLINQPEIQQKSIQHQKCQKNNAEKSQEKRQFQSNDQRNRLTIQKLAELYEMSQGKRYVERQYQLFVRQPELESELFKNYGIRQLSIKNKLREICNGIQSVRGDGNCFYTAFGYQFLQILLIKYTQEEFYDFIKWIKNSDFQFKIYFQDFSINNKQEEYQLLDEFLFRLERIRLLHIDKRLQTLYEEFSAYEIDDGGIGCLYGLSTIFFRNLANHLIEKSPMKEALYDRENLLKWETECNNNEIVIQNLAEQLHLHVQLVFFQNQDINLQEYCKENHEKIILLIRPGHYNIGVQIHFP